MLVLGAGPIGLAAVIAATAAGLEVMVADPDAHRRQLWGDLAKLNEVARDWTEGDGPPPDFAARRDAGAVRIQITVSGGGAET